MEGVILSLSWYLPPLNPEHKPSRLHYRLAGCHLTPPFWKSPLIGESEPTKVSAQA